MPWKECSLDERMKFIARLLDGEMMSAVCREFNISRKTGYKLLQRYRDSGLHELTDRSRRPYRQASQLPVQVETLIVRLRRERPAGAHRRCYPCLRVGHDFAGDPGRIRTCDHRLRRPVLYPAELRDRCADGAASRTTVNASRVFSGHSGNCRNRKSAGASPASVPRPGSQARSSRHR